MDEELVELEGPIGRCSSTAATQIARVLAAGRDGSARLHRIVSGEGLHDDATSTRWEFRFDLPNRLSVLDVVVTFTFDEDARRFGGAVASISQTPFPPPGSELERMAVNKVLSRRRVRGIWRQNVAGHRHLPSRIPDASEAVRLLRSEARPLGELRSVEAVVPRSGGPSWIVSGAEGRHRIRWFTSGQGSQSVHF